jgi:hypothetical protein
VVLVEVDVLGDLGAELVERRLHFVPRRLAAWRPI